MITLKNENEIEVMREGGKISAGALKRAISFVKPGVKTIDLDEVVDEYILKHNGEHSFKKVKGYKFATCININEGLVHGLPGERVIKKGDLVKIDLGVLYKGFNTDLSYTVEVETNSHSKFLESGKKALARAIRKCVVGNRIGDISSAIQTEIESNGYSVSLELIGHGVGRSLHEAPSVPGYGTAGTGPTLKEGLTIAIEVIYQMGKPDIDYEKDGWTIITQDRSLAGLFEHTVAITKEGPIVLTEE